MPDPILELTGVSCGYQGRDVLHDVSMTVETGTFLAIIGPNGHGKTTLLRAVSGLLRLRAGTIRVGGQSTARLRPDEIVALGVVHVPQGDLLFPDMTVLENLQMGAYLPAAASQMQARLEEVFELFPQLRSRQHQAASTLSGGERRMTGIGRGLMTGGRVLMLDEPSLGLAPIIIDQIYAVIDRLRATGRTILLVEENAARAADKADQIHLLDNGRFVWNGAGPELMHRPEILETYLGS